MAGVLHFVSRYSLDLSGCVGELDGERFLVSHGECAQELADGIETIGQSLRSKCSQETSDFGSGLGHLGFRSAVANVSEFFLMCGEHWPQSQKRM
jgi:hypothetical protein